MWNKELSVLLYKGLIILDFIMAAAVGIWLPGIIGWIEEYYYRPLGHAASCIFAYSVIITACVLLFFLFVLLTNISKKKVFIPENVKTLRMIAWCCFIIAAILCVWGIITMLEVIFLIAFVAGFMGLILRVLKNVMEEAVNIKEENDFTV